EILQGGRHLLTLVNEILDLSKIEAGRVDLAREWTSVGRLVQSVLGTVRPLSEARSVGLEIALPPELPDLFVDAVRMKQVLFNLLANGIKFTEPGGLVRLSAHVDGDRRVAIVVADTGVGIRAEDLPRLFREFERLAPPPGAEQPEGTGLGLALTKR